MAKEKKSNKFVNSIKQGFTDIQLVLQEGNYKLFVKQLIVIVMLVFGYRYVNQQFAQQETLIAGKKEAIHIQQNSESDYLRSKQRLLELEPRFPDMESKNDWLLRQIVAVFRDVKMTPKIGSSQSENASNNGYVVASIPVELDLSYDELGRLLANIENRDEYLRVSEFTLQKQSQNLGHNTVRLRFNTIFPKEKIAATIFKDGKGGK